ncbi:MAG: DUF2064 domain-containing protein [candidate division Zixibacteria bacterium]|nr:DUF2064 domain-containing protein [candidate division Zixibacteria bacterium]
MSPKKKHESVIAICIQEPTEDGSCMNMGAIRGDDLRILNEAFVVDTVRNALGVDGIDVRLYHNDLPDQRHAAKHAVETAAEAGKAENGRFMLRERTRERWGTRIEGVFRDCFDSGYKHVLVFGNRTPTITSAMMATALRMLKESDAVFGPTPDGRYYVIGMSGSMQIDLSGFDWKSPHIYSDVAHAFTKKKLSWSELEIWYAIENVDDLEIMARDINQYRFEGDDDTARNAEDVMERLIAKLEP